MLFENWAFLLPCFNSIFELFNTTHVLAFWTKYDFKPEDWSDKPLLYRNRCFFIWVNLPNAVCGKDKLIIPMIKDPKQSVIAQDQIKLI